MIRSALGACLLLAYLPLTKGFAQGPPWCRSRTKAVQGRTLSAVHSLRTCRETAVEVVLVRHSQ